MLRSLVPDAVRRAGLLDIRHHWVTRFVEDVLSEVFEKRDSKGDLGINTFVAGVLSGGRLCVEDRTGLYLWSRGAGPSAELGSGWAKHSLSYWHNVGLGTDSPWRFAAAAVNASRALPRFSTCYTSLVSTGARSGFVVYGGGSRAFAMRFRLKHPTRRDYAAATTAAAATESSGHQKRVTHPDNS